MRGQVRVVPVAQIEYITASGPYAELHTAERGYVIRERMQALEERLDPARFLRIHRSIIVRLDTIDTLLRGGGLPSPARPDPDPARSRPGPSVIALQVPAFGMHCRLLMSFTERTTSGEQL